MPLPAPRIWFRRRRVGALRRLRITPVRWQGWMVLALMIAAGVALDFGAALLMTSDAYPDWSRVVVHGLLLLAVIGIIISVCWHLSEADSKTMSEPDSKTTPEADSENTPEPDGGSPSAPTAD